MSCVLKRAWECLKVLESAWGCLRMFQMFENVWECLRMLENAWECLKIPENSWECLTRESSGESSEESSWECSGKSLWKSSGGRSGEREFERVWIWSTFIKRWQSHALYGLVKQLPTNKTHKVKVFITVPYTFLVKKFRWTARGRLWGSAPCSWITSWL